jgi:hypothetical protein
MGKNQDSDPGSGMTIPNHISESLENFFGLKVLQFFDADPDPVFEIFLNRDPEGKNSDPG